MNTICRSSIAEGIKAKLNNVIKGLNTFPRFGLRPVLLQDYFGTGLRHYFVVEAKIVPQRGVSNRNKTSA
jgi:hypothetical protein